MNWKTLISEVKAGLGITQAQIAQRVGISQVSVSDLETGRTREPSYSTGTALVALHRKARRRMARKEAAHG